MPDEKVVPSKTDEEILAEAPEEEAKEGAEEEVEEAPEEEAEGEEVEEKAEEKAEEEEAEEEPPKRLPHERPTLREVKAKYPEFFKDFPSLRDAFFREQEYTSVFPTVEDAREALEDVEAYRVLQDGVLSGECASLLDSIGEVDRDALTKFVTSFLPTLYKRDTGLYTEIITPLFERMVRAAYSHGIASGDEDLANGTLHVSKYLFDTEDVATGKKTVSRPREESPEVKKLEDQRRAFNVERYQVFYKDVSEDIGESLRATVLKNFDPDGVFTPFLKRLCVDEIVDQVGRALEADTNHMAVMKSHWVRAGRDGYTRAAKDKIVAAYLARARSLVPSIREKVRREALGTATKATRKTGKEVEKAGSEKEMPVGASERGSGGPIDARKVDWSKTTDLDFLRDRVTMRS